MVLSAAPAVASPQTVLDAAKAASGDWSGKIGLELDYAYAGQGLTGTMRSVDDLKGGAFVDSYVIGPTSGATGFDGSHVWLREPSGTVTPQEGGDMVPLAVNESYRNRNLWWSPDRGGATIIDAGQKTENGRSFAVLAITPRGGKSFEAWFDIGTHLLVRTIEAQGPQTITADFSDYKPHEGALIAGKIVTDDGSHNLQTQTLTAARFVPEPPDSVFAAPAENLHDFTIAGGAHQATVPFQLVNNHIYANVSINGGAQALFIFDTGGHSILSPALARTLKVQSQGNQTSSGAGDALAESGVGTVRSIRIGDVTVTDQPVSVLDMFAPGVEGVPEVGMIGYEVFARFVTRFDYGARTITFIDKASFDPRDAGTPVKMRLYQQFPEVDGTYDGMPGAFGIDTGSRFSLILTGPWAKKTGLRDKAKNAVPAMTGWGVGGPSRGLVMRGGLLTLGSVPVPHPLTEISTDTGGAAAAGFFPNNIGGGILKRFVVTLDYQHATLYLKPVTGQVADLDTFDRSGMWFNQAADGYKIVDVTKGGPADEVGLKPGDMILQADGKSVGDVPLYELRRKLREEPVGTQVKLDIKSGDARRTATLTLRDQLQSVP
jgi:hypothetical protein